MCSNIETLSFFEKRAQHVTNQCKELMPLLPLALARNILVPELCAGDLCREVDQALPQIPEKALKRNFEVCLAILAALPLRFSEGGKDTLRPVKDN